MEDILAQLKAIEDRPVRGHIRMLDDTRFVFVGEAPGVSDNMYLGFRNSDGEDTQVVLSKEAYEALKYLINEPFKGKRVPFPYKPKWRIKFKVTEKIM